MTWYYSKNGQQLGPISEQELSSKSSSGEISARDLVWKEGMSDWKPLGEVMRFTPSGIPPMPRSMEGSVMMQQPPVFTGGQIRPEIPSYLWQSIVATVLCCMPFGIVAIVYAAKVDSCIATGNWLAANEASRNAKTWVIVSAGLGLLGYLPILVLFLIGAFAETFAPV
jgi:hypothetical protein